LFIAAIFRLKVFASAVAFFRSLLASFKLDIVEENIINITINMSNQKICVIDKLLFIN